MPLEERRARHQVLFQVISDNDLNSWGEHFLAALSKSGTPPQLHEDHELGPAVTAGLA
jgi:trehalose-6-phosphate synthase